MLDILSITGVIFVLILTGYLTVRLGAFAASDMVVFGKFVVTLALPALVLRAVTSRPLAEIANPGYLGAFLLGSLLVFALAYLWSRQLTHAAPATSTFRAMGMSCANSGFVGYPVMLMALPEIAAPALAMNMIVENLVFIPLTLICAEHARRDEGSAGRIALRIAGRLARTPVIIALFLGLVISASGLALPGILARAIDITAASSAALSLVVIGGTLVGLSVHSVNARVLFVAMGKLVLHPLAVALSLLIMALLGFAVTDPDLAAAAVIMAAMPVMGIYPILAQRYGEGQEAALTMFVMTILSFVTITVTLALTLP
ncbi:AEC family transporter [Antarctobacter jejuensis]|uniref:AEC family transporter n=1 Tax=Antarctobacter jejuensis TaxID=1439938 RepID=UPI003FD304DC